MGSQEQVMPDTGTHVPGERICTAVSNETQLRSALRCAFITCNSITKNQALMKVIVPN